MIDGDKYVLEASSLSPMNFYLRVTLEYNYPKA